MLFNEEIAGLHEDGFEGSISESRIFTEVFLQNSNKRCLVTGVINFECCHSKRTDMSFSSKSENSAMTSQLDSCNVKRDSRENSALGCFPDGCDLLMRGDCDANRKRMRLSIDKHSYSRPFSRPVFNSSAPSKGVSGMYQPASQSVGHTVTCRLVESSSHGVSSSCYMLKRHAETNSRGEPGHRNVSKSRLQSLDGNDEKEVNASKAIASPVSQESSATKLLITSPLVTIVSRSRSHRHAEEIMRRSNHVGLPDELPEAKITPNKDSMKDPRPLLRYHIQNLLRAAGWEIGRRKRENISGEFLYFSPWGGRPIREFRRVWNSCGQSLFSDGNIVVQEDSKKWTDMSHFWYDLSNTFIKIEEELSHTETTSALAHWWYLLDPFANMVFIDKKLGTLRAGKAIKARRSLVIDTTTKHDAVLDLKNVDAIGNRSKRYSKDRLCGSSVTRESSSTVSAGIYCFCKERCGTRDHSSGCLFEVPVASENANIMLGGSDAFLPHQDCNTNSPSCDRHGFGHCKVMASEVKQNVLVSFCGDKIFSKKVENQLKDSLDDHLNCRSDDLTQSDHPGRTYGLSNTRRVIVPHKELFLENSHLGDVNGEEVLQYYGGIQNEGDQCIEASKFKMSGASSVASATTRKKARNKSKWSFHKKDRLGLSSSYKIERHDINGDNVPLESVGVDESFIAIDGKTDKNCKYSFSCSFQHKDGKKPLRFRKFHKNSGIPKKSNQFSYEEFKFENITDECPLHIMNESLYPEAWRQEVKSEKPETQNTCVQKRSITCCLKDDDLLISAFIKNKSNGSTNKQSTQKMKSCKSDVPRKRKSQKGSCRLLPRSLGKGGKHIEGKWSIFGVRTVLSWLIHSGVVSLNEVIQFRNSKDDAVIKDGLVTRDGILCRCCNMNFSVSEFKIHAGFKLKRPCLNLFMESGKPFTLCQLEAWSAEYKARKTATRPVHGEVMDQNDDSCGLCGDGGELICCDNCPSTFHQACLYAQELPEGSWYCPYCTCHICGGGGDGHREPSKSPGALKCSQCEHTYHEACLKGKGTCGEVASDAWFCSESCQEIYLGLHSNIGVLNLLSDGFSWTLLRCIHGDQRVHSAQRFVALKAECNSKLAVALTIMEECFLSMVDSRTGIDMIPHVLYNWGSQFARLNYNGFHAVLLEKNDVLMSVASIRIHGVTVAEVPLIATCSKYRRQGMCRRLMNTIEEMLKAFKVEKLVMSAIPSLVETWTVGFGFEPMEDNERKSLSDFNLMVFPGTVWLKKPIYDKEATNQQGSGHASSLIGYDPPEPGACFKGGPIVESTKQADGSSSVKEVGILTEIGHTDCKNPRAEEDRNGISQKHFPKLSCEKWASDGRESPLEMVCLVESRVKHDERELYFNEQSQKDHILQDNEK